jgi:hypothetical protein
MKLRLVRWLMELLMHTNNREEYDILDRNGVAR